MDLCESVKYQYNPNGTDYPRRKAAFGKLDHSDVGMAKNGDTTGKNGRTNIEFEYDDRQDFPETMRS